MPIHSLPANRYWSSAILCRSATWFAAAIAICFAFAIRPAWTQETTDPPATPPPVAVSSDSAAVRPPLTTGGLAPVGFRAGITTSPDSALAVALAALGGEVLPLGAAVDAALGYATNVREAEAGVAAARGATRRERGAFDPTVFAGADWGEQDFRAESPLFTGVEVVEHAQTLAEGGARITLPIGTELEAAVGSQRLTTNERTVPLSPQYEVTGRLALRQPVLKGFGPAARQELSSAERALEAAEARFDDAVLTTQAEVEQTYWDLYAGMRDLAVQRLIRERAEAFLAETQLRAQAGLVGPNEVANARVFLAEQQQAELDRDENADRISDALASLIGRRPAATSRFRTMDEPPHDFPLEDQDALVARAVEQNLALKAAEEDVAAVRALADGARWDALPTLDIIGSIGGNGLAGNPRPIQFFGQDTLLTDAEGDLGDAFDQVVHRDFPTWSAGVRVEVPIPLREGRGERDRLRGEVARAEQRQLAIRHDLEEEVRAAHRELAHSMRRLEVARSGVDASLEQVRIGGLEYSAGRTTAFELVRLGADLATAQQRYSQALVRTAKAASELRRLTSGAYPAPPPGTAVPPGEDDDDEDE